MKKALILAAVLALFAWPAAAQTLNPPTGGTTTAGDADPAQFSSPAGTLTIGGSVGAVTIDADTSVIPTYATGTSLPATCTPFATSFLDTDSTTTLAYDCIGTNTWAGRFTIADDSILVGTGTTTASKAIPDCDDSAGQHLNYDTATNAFSCGTSSSASSTFDPGTAFHIYEEFATGDSTTGRLGTNGVAAALISSGTVSSTVAGTAAHPGLNRMLSAAGDNSGAGFFLINGNGQGVSLPSVGTYDWTYDVIAQPGSNSTAITNTSLTVGLWSVYSGDTSAATRAIWIRHDSDLSDTTFVFAVCNAAGAAGCNAAGDAANQKTVASTITPVAGTFYRFRIQHCLTCGPAGVEMIGMRVNDETEKTFCSSGCDDTLGTFDTSGLHTVGLIYLSRTTTASLSADVDYMYFAQTGMTRY